MTPARWRSLLAVVLVLAAGLFAWQGTWRGGFVFDDHPAIVDNQALLRGDWWQAAFGAEHQPLANRPLTCLSLVADFVLFGPGPFGPHLTNLLLHLGNALLLLATLRRALLAPNLAGRLTPAAANAIAVAVAVLWVAHPLGADAVAYATQRSTLLGSGCLLLALLATLRAHASPRPMAWRMLVLLALCGGMASKEDFVVAPVLLLLFERAFLLPHWSALRARIGWYAAMAATWSVLIVCMALGPHNATVGYDTVPPVTARQWSMTQAGVVLHYLRLAVWPQPLRGAYDWPIVQSFGDAALPGLLVCGLLAAVVVAWRRRPWWAWLGALFFLLLAPTSTVLPIVTEIVAERRAYLPMLAVLVPLVVVLQRLLARAWPRSSSWLTIVVAAAVTVPLGLATRERVAIYGDERTFWADAFAKRDPASRSHLAATLLASHGIELSKQGRMAESFRCFDQVLECEQPSVLHRLTASLSLTQRGRYADAIVLLRQLVQEEPGNGRLWGSLGLALAGWHEHEHGRADDVRLVEAEAALQRAVAAVPTQAQFWTSLAYVFAASGRLADAETACRQATGLPTASAGALSLHVDLLYRLGRPNEAAPLLARWLPARPRDAGLRYQLAEVERAHGDVAAAMQLLEDALRLEPTHAQAAALLRQLRADRPR